MSDVTECPFCGESVGLHALQCEHCGERLAPPTRESVLDQETGIGEMLDGKVDSLAMAYLRGAELRGAYLSGVDLFHADLAASDLRGADLGGANLGNANLRCADLSGANLRQADLSAACLEGADLSGANLIGADLDGALYDAFTRWPDPFDPDAAGAIDRSLDGPGG